MMMCNRCGAYCTEGRFCYRCGNMLIGENRSKKSLIYGFISIACVLLDILCILIVPLFGTITFISLGTIGFIDLIIFSLFTTIQIICIVLINNNRKKNKINRLPVSKYDNIGRNMSIISIGCMSFVFCCWFFIILIMDFAKSMRGY